MKKRRRAKAAKKTASRARKEPQEAKLVEKGVFVAPMPPPNHLVPVDFASECEIRRLRLSAGQRWPLMQLASEDPGGLAGTFVDPCHGERHWSYWIAHPPSWMDPVIFVKMALEDSRIAKLLDTAVRRNDKNAWKKLSPLLDEVFAEVYLPYVFRKFEGSARDQLAQWMLRQAAYRKTRPETE